MLAMLLRAFLHLSTGWSFLLLGLLILVVAWNATGRLGSQRPRDIVDIRLVLLMVALTLLVVILSRLWP